MQKTKRITAGLLLMILLATMMVSCAESKDLMKPFREEEKAIEDYVTLGQYLGVEAEKVEVQEVDEALMETYRNQLLYTYAEFSPVERAAQDGDKVVISYVGYMDGEAFEGGTAEHDEATLGMDEYIPGFEEGIVGMEIGQTKNVPVVFPDDYWSADFAGKEAYFEITLEKVSEPILPTYDDAFVKEYLGFGSVKEYENYIKESLEMEYQADAESNQLLAVWQAVRDNCTIIEYPEDEVETYLADYTEYYTSMAAYSGLDLETYLNDNYAMTLQEFNDTVLGWAHEEIGDMLIVKAIINAEGMEISEEEYAQAKLTLLGDMGYTSEDEFEADYEMGFEDYYGEENIKLAVLQEQVFQLVLDNAILS